MTETIGDEKASEKFGRHLGLVGATNIGLGAMLGGGIYVISGTAAGMIGPALVIAYFFTGLLAMFTAVNYAEIASSIPKQGGGYTFAHDTIGGLPAFLTGWFLMIGNIVACGLYALAVAHTLVVFIPDGVQYVAWIALIIIAITFVTNTVSVKSVSGVLGILNIAQAIIIIINTGIAWPTVIIRIDTLDSASVSEAGIVKIRPAISPRLSIQSEAGYQ